MNEGGTYQTQDFVTPLEETQTVFRALTFLLKGKRANN